jgi:hypothetical protein
MHRAPLGYSSDVCYPTTVCVTGGLRGRNLEVLGLERGSLRTARADGPSVGNLDGVASPPLIEEAISITTEHARVWVAIDLGFSPTPASPLQTCCGVRSRFNHSIHIPDSPQAIYSNDIHARHRSSGRSRDSCYEPNGYDPATSPLVRPAGNNIVSTHASHNTLVSSCPGGHP